VAKDNQGANIVFEWELWQAVKALGPKPISDQLRIKETEQIVRSHV
jgi:hypothetical protein